MVDYQCTNCGQIHRNKKPTIGFYDIHNERHVEGATSCGCSAGQDAIKPIPGTEELKIEELGIDEDKNLPVVEESGPFELDEKLVEPEEKHELETEERIREAGAGEETEAEIAELNEYEVEEEIPEAEIKTTENIRIEKDEKVF